ncbi:hypothetical protein [Balneola vulgaris]|jgi:hypothetical protein|uniref:hypothetical protein n=1 Tax=Balneola vulgaris TaxID=287535 RepID=UPI00036803E0|nr:hypothetical protein [Balneola vulgaris]
MKSFNIEISNVEKGPKELMLQLPIQAEVVKQLPGKDRPDYFLAKLESPVLWVDKARGINLEISYMVICSKFKGQKIDNGMKDLKIAIAYVIDDSIINDNLLSLKKLKYVAIGDATALKKWGIF